MDYLVNAIISALAIISILLHVRLLYVAFCFRRADNILVQTNIKIPFSNIKPTGKDRWYNEIFPRWSQKDNWYTAYVISCTMGVVICWSIISLLHAPGYLDFLVIITFLFTFWMQLMFLDYSTGTKVDKYILPENMSLSNYFYSIATALVNKENKAEYIDTLGKLVYDNNNEVTKRSEYLMHLFYIFVTKTPSDVTLDICSSKTDYYSDFRKGLLGNKNPYRHLIQGLLSYNKSFDSCYLHGSRADVLMDFTKVLHDSCNIAKKI